MMNIETQGQRHMRDGGASWIFNYFGRGFLWGGCYRSEGLIWSGWEVSGIRVHDVKFPKN